MNDFSTSLEEMEITIERVREQLRRLEIETETQVLFRHEINQGQDYEEFDPLEMDRYSQLQQLSRSLSESASDMLDLKETLAFKARESETLLIQQARVNTELQEGLMRTRMVPFNRLLPRLRRTVRQVARELGKEVDFHAYNAEGELDRNVLERMVPPLEHMLRNAVDHGIERAEFRRGFGKPDVGRIDLRLSREAGDVVIEISDDGAGIDVESVRAKALERGLMAADARLRDDEVLQFVFAPGFSTAKSVTQISGRGVGMDVVHSAVKQLGGSISITSMPGKGTRFTRALAIHGIGEPRLDGVGGRGSVRDPAEHDRRHRAGVRRRTRKTVSARWRRFRICRRAVSRALSRQLHRPRLCGAVRSRLRAGGAGAFGRSRGCGARRRCARQPRNRREEPRSAVRRCGRHFRRDDSRRRQRGRDSRSARIDPCADRADLRQRHA